MHQQNTWSCPPFLWREEEGGDFTERRVYREGILLNGEFLQRRDTSLARRMLMWSSSTVSRFFSRKPSAWYSTRSAKWLIMNAERDIRGFSKCRALPRCLSYSFWHQFSSDPFGIYTENNNCNDHILFFIYPFGIYTENNNCYDHILFFIYPFGIYTENNNSNC